MVNDITSQAVATGYEQPLINKRETPVSADKAAVSDVSSNADARQNKVNNIDLQQAVKELQSFASSMQRNLDFSIDDATGRSVVKVVDRETDKIIRQIPNETALSIAQNLERIKGILFEDVV